MRDILKSRSRATKLLFLLSSVVLLLFISISAFKWFKFLKIKGYPKADVDKMTYEEIIDYIRWPNAGSCEFERDFGNGTDGRKSVCFDPKLRPDPDNCLVYSFGTIHEWTFDEAIADYGCNVFAFDPTIHQASYIRSKKIVVFKMGLSFENETSPQNWTMLPLKTIYRMMTPLHGTATISVLKLDMEDFDLRALADVLTSGILSRVEQIALEVHIEPEATIDQLRDFIEIVQVK